MNNAIGRILTAVGVLIVLYLGVVISSSVVQLANAADRIYLGSGQVVFWILLALFFALIAIPFILYFTLPDALTPPANNSAPQRERYMKELRRRLQANRRLQGVSLDTEKDIQEALGKLSVDVDKVIRETAISVFVGTAVMQNGRMDGLIVLATQLRMVWRIATIYYQRPSPQQMVYLYSNVGATAIVADNIQEVDFSALAGPIVTAILPSLKGAIPGLQGIATLLTNSIANGSANAFLTLRVGIIARHYCEAVTTTSSQSVRMSATKEAAKLLGQIAKDNGSRLVGSIWGSVKNTAKTSLPWIGDKKESHE